MNNIATILINVGSPISCDLKSVKDYLRQFLMDKYVININYFARFCLINFLIIPFRSPKTLEAYRSVWNNEKNLSPLLAKTYDLCEKLQKNDETKILCAMRYGAPSIKQQIEHAIHELKVWKIFFIPLYPHYAESTLLTSSEEIKKCMKNYQIPYQIKDLFYNDDEYINILVDQSKNYLTKDYDHLIFSYHGLPVSHLKEADVTQNHCYKNPNCCKVASEAHKFCYKHQVLKTTELFLQKAGIEHENHSVVFQSRLGRAEWIRPSLVEEIERLKKLGKKKMLVICPSFVTDCLETLEEVEIGIKEEFEKDNPGVSLEMIPCLNDNEKWVNLLQSWINDFDNQCD